MDQHRILDCAGTTGSSSSPYQHGKPARQRTSPGDSEHPDCAIRKETLTLKPV